MSQHRRLRVALGSDHAGFRVKSAVKEALSGMGHDAVDLGAHSEESTDYPEYAHSVSQAVASGEADRGVLVCGSGIGMSMSANRHRGVRAALVWTEELAVMARKHNDANILVLPGRYIDEEAAIAALQRFLEVEFEGGRHERRVRKIDA